MGWCKNFKMLNRPALMMLNGIYIPKRVIKKIFLSFTKNFQINFWRK